MPIPIGLVNGTTERPSSNALLDISFLANEIPTKEASAAGIKLADKDAEDLMKIWLHAKKTSKDTFLIESMEMDNKDLLRLKSRGLISGGTGEVRFTPKAKTVITTMTLGENNKFLEKKKEKSYSEILASMDKRNKAGFRIAMVFDENSHLINLS